MKGISLSSTMVVVAAMAVYAVLAIVREVLVSAIRRRKRIMRLDNLELAETVIDYVAIIAFPIYIISCIYNPMPISGWWAIAWIGIILLYGIAMVAQIIRHL